MFICECFHTCIHNPSMRNVVMCLCMYRSICVHSLTYNIIRIGMIVYVCMHICIVHTYIYVCIRTYVYVHVYMYVCICPCVFPRVYVERCMYNNECIETLHN